MLLGRPGVGRWRGRVFNDQFNKIQVVVRMIRTITKFPIFLVAVFMASMYVIDGLAVVANYRFPYQAIVSLLVFMVGVLIIAIGGYSFRQANTTVNPSTPEQTTQLVKSGLYTYSRNPMYIGFFAWLVAVAIFIGNPINILLLPVYVVLVNRLYIVPEEIALERLFGNDFVEYKDKVRRWL